VRAEGDQPVIAGHFAVFDEISAPLGGFREIIKPGAFAESLASGGDVKALRNHDPDKILGSVAAGSLTLREDGHGLYAEIRPKAITRDVSETIELISAGELRSASFAFQATDEEWTRRDGEDVREVRAARLIDVSPVTYPAYESAGVYLRALRTINGGELTIDEIRDTLTPIKRENEGAHGEPAILQALDILQAELDLEL
jgi:HK97 family phage prohead protease